MTYVNLDRAVVCLNDDVIFPVDARACPVCTSESFVPLATWLGMIREEEVA